MKNLSCLLLIIFFCISCECEKKKPQSFNYSPNFKALQVDQERISRIDNLLQEQIDKGILPHVLTFVAKNGEVIHHKAFGWKDMENQVALEQDDIFRMYSQTKAIVTVALMTLFEQGKFQLDDPVSMYIPEMTDQVRDGMLNDTTFKTRKAVSPVRIRHILSHSSGITGLRRNRNAPPYETLDAYVKDLVKAPLVFDPGTEWNYNPSSDVMAYLVEYFSGKPLQEYLQETIFDPLDIKDMAYFYDSSYKSRFVNIYRESNGKMEPVEMWSGRNPFSDDRRYAGGASGLNGTIEGYARFCQMILNYGEFNGHRILGRRTVEMMAKDQLVHPNSGGNDFYFGLGFEIYPEKETVRDYIPSFTPMVSPGSLSWGGMANTDYIIDPKEGLIILLYTNRVPDTKIWEKFINTVYQVLE